MKALKLALSRTSYRIYLVGIIILGHFLTKWGHVKNQNALFVILFVTALITMFSFLYYMNIAPPEDNQEESIK